MPVRTQINGFISLFRSAAAAAAAIEGGYGPKARDLRTLGIDPEQFRKIGR